MPLLRVRKMTKEKLILTYHAEDVCEDCGDDLLEPEWTNQAGQRVHVTSVPNNHYYNDGSARCDACHDQSR